jgi:hypothetical protein
MTGHSVFGVTKIAFARAISLLKSTEVTPHRCFRTRECSPPRTKRSLAQKSQPRAACAGGFGIPNKGVNY